MPKNSLARPICHKHPVRPCYACRGFGWKNKTTRCDKCSFSGDTMPNFTDRRPCQWCV